MPETASFDTLNNILLNILLELAVDYGLHVRELYLKIARWYNITFHALSESDTTLNETKINKAANCMKDWATHFSLGCSEQIILT